jgi:hypothetical protein
LALAGLAFVLAACTESDRLARFQPPASRRTAGQAVVTAGRFSGYTNYWHSIFWNWHQYGNLYQISQPDVPNSILQSKVDIAEELGVPGLVLQEGFLAALTRSAWREMDEPAPEALAEELASSDVLVTVASSGSLGQRLMAKLPAGNSWPEDFKSHQANAADFHRVHAFFLRDGTRALYVLASDCRECRTRTARLIKSVIETLREFDLHRGWFGAGTLLHSVTCHPGHPLEVIGRGMNQGNDWFTFSGYMDYLLQGQLPDWLSRVNLSIVTDVGTGKAAHSFGSVAFGCRDWDGFKIQDTPTENEWIKFVKDRGGYIFRPVYSPDCDPFSYDGYIAVEGNKKQIDAENVPFILQTGYVREEAPASMVLFLPRGTPLTRESMWEAILARREVGVLPQAKMMGPELFRNVLQMLLLDRVYLEDHFGDRIQVEAAVEGRELIVSLVNTAGETVSGTLEISAAPELEIQDAASRPVDLAAYSGKTVAFRLQPTLQAMGRTNPVLIAFKWPSGVKKTLAIMDLPRAISAHQLLYGQTPEVVYPVSIHNFSVEESFPVDLKAFESGRSATPVFQTRLQADIRPAEFGEMTFRLPLSPGSYEVEVSALGARNTSRLGVETARGAPRAYEIDLDGDGVSEYRLENGKVLVTLLATGARIIEYIVKEKKDNVLFKLWPDREWSTDKRPFRERGFYPYGGFEDFLGQASMETHKVYGNRLEKIFTLYGDTPLVEVRFALAFRNPEANMLGPQPILELGRRHWTEDMFVVPSLSGRREFRMRPEEYFGDVIFLEEGWNAGRDTAEDVSFVGAFPVSEPEFLHMWMNHPSNAESRHYYVEFQPWVPIFQKTVRYFTYYLWGAAGAWENGLAELRKRNLITSRE